MCAIHEAKTPESAVRSCYVVHSPWRNIPNRLEKAFIRTRYPENSEHSGIISCRLEV